jgi:hypothetical protein
MNLPAQNLDKLNEDTKALIAYIFNKIYVGWTLCYMVEVKLDDPVNNLLNDRNIVHGGNGSPHYAQHIGDNDWAVIHCDNVEWQNINSEALILRGQIVAYGETNDA